MMHAPTFLWQILKPARLAWLATVAAFLALTGSSRAQVILSAPTISAAPGSSGAFDLLIGDSGGSFHIAGTSLGLSLSGPAGVHFTGVTIGTTTPYIFTVSGTTQGGGPFSNDTFPNTQFTAVDSDFSVQGFRALVSGQSFGLAHVLYSVDSNATTGPRTMSYVPIDTSLSDEFGNNVSFTSQNGTFTVVPVPEPGGLLLGAVGGAAFWLARQRRRASV